MHPHISLLDLPAHVKLQWHTQSGGTRSPHASCCQLCAAARGDPSLQCSSWQDAAGLAASRPPGSPVPRGSLTLCAPTWQGCVEGPFSHASSRLLQDDLLFFLKTKEKEGSEFHTMCIELKTKRSGSVSVGLTVLCSASRGSGYALITPVLELGTVLVTQT